MPTPGTPDRRLRVVVLFAAFAAFQSISVGLLLAQLGATRPAVAEDEAAGTPSMLERRREDFDAERAFPFDRIPEAAVERAWAERSAAMARKASVRTQASGTEWKSLGPAPDQMAPGQLTGRVRAIAVHPLDPSIIYVGAASGGVWKTVNDGASWRPITDQQCSLNTGALAIDPVNPRVIYVGTGEPNQTLGCGILRSSDDGASWEQFGNAALRGAGITRILIDPSTAGAPDRTTIYVGSITGIFKSTDGGRTLQRLSPSQGGDLWMDARDSRTLYAALYPSTTPGQIAKTTDGGATWTTLGGGLPSGVGYATLALDPRSSRTLYAVVSNTTGSTLLGIYKSTDAGQSWVELGRTGTTPRCGQAATALQVACRNCWYNIELAVDPVVPGVLYFGEVNFYRSTDDGATWHFLRLGKDNCGRGTYVFGDNHTIEFDRNGRMLLGNDGGVIASTTRADSWTNLNTNLSLRQFYRGTSLHPTDPSIIFAGAQDLAVMRFTGGTWVNVYFGDGGYSVIDEANPSTVYVEHQWSAGSGSGVARSDNGGTNFTLKQNGITLSDRASFIPPLVIDRKTPNRLAFGTYRVYLTDDRAETWRVASPELATQSGHIRTLAFAPSNGAVLWAGTSLGTVWLTEDSGASWTNVSTGLPTRTVTDIAVSPDDPRTAYITLSGTGSSHVYKTSNGGRSWTARSTGLPDIAANAILIDRNPGTLFAGTDVGVYRSPNDGESWDLFSDGLPNVPVTELVQNVRLGLLVAATYGRGLYVIGGLCSSAINPIVSDVAAGGGDVQVTVTAPCAWTTNVDATNFPWVRVAGRSGDVVTITVSPNTGPDRIAQVNVAAQVLVIRQKGR